MEEVKKQEMESLFVPYEIALKLKELGFNEKCFNTYTEDKVLIPYCTGTYYFPAPIFQQVFRWFRDKYGLIGYIQTSYVTNEVVNNRNIPCTPRIEFTFGITNTIGKSIFSSFKQGSFKTYEEAELEGLKKLIEIFKC